MLWAGVCRVTELDCPGGVEAARLGSFCRCDAASLAIGSCLPGEYRYRYSVANAAGEAGEPRFRTIRVEQQAEAAALLEAEFSMRESELPGTTELQAFAEQYFVRLANATFPTSNTSALGQVSLEVVEMQRATTPGRWTPFLVPASSAIDRQLSSVIAVLLLGPASAATAYFQTHSLSPNCRH